MTALAACGEPVAFDPIQATYANQPMPHGSAEKVCGSSVKSYLSELSTISNPAEAKVTRHWGPIVPGGTDMAGIRSASGTVLDAGTWTGDLPLDHAFGGDMSADVQLNPLYSALSYNAGTAGEGNKPGVIHVELQSGLLPHKAPTGGSLMLPAGASWPDAANLDMENIYPGFMPQPGDFIALSGHWVLDCGHPDFHSELHPIVYMAFGHAQGGSTVAHLFYNPYDDAQVYNADPSISGHVNDGSRLASGSTLVLTKWIIPGLMNLLQPNVSTAVIPELQIAEHVSPPATVVCSPQASQAAQVGTTHTGAAAGSVSASYDLSVRPGVSVKVVPDSPRGCATVDITLTSSYSALDPTGQEECPVPWKWIDDQVAGNGFGNLNILDIASQKVSGLLPPPAAASIVSKLAHQPQVNCFAPLGLSGIVAPTAGMHTVVTAPSQAFPVAGWVEVTGG